VAVQHKLEPPRPIPLRKSEFDRAFRLAVLPLRRLRLGRDYIAGVAKALFDIDPIKAIGDAVAAKLKCEAV
jgi:hypothetical protein